MSTEGNTDSAAEVPASCASDQQRHQHAGSGGVMTVFSELALMLARGYIRLLATRAHEVSNEAASLQIPLNPVDVVHGSCRNVTVTP